MTQRYFRSSAAVYESMRIQLDAAFGFPDSMTHTVWFPVESAVRDAEHRCLLAVRASSCERQEVSAVLPGLLASGHIEEIDRETYMAALPPE